VLYTGPRTWTDSLAFGKPEQKSPLGGCRSRLGDIIKIDLKEIECDGVNWIHQTYDRDQWRTLVNTEKFVE
jgi:hypothetical protein